MTKSFPHHVHRPAKFVHMFSPKRSADLGKRFSPETVTRPLSAPVLHRVYPQASTGCAPIPVDFHICAQAMGATRRFCLCTQTCLWIIPVDNPERGGKLGGISRAST